MTAVASQAQSETVEPPRARPSRSDTNSAWMFLLPFLVIYVIFLIFPVIQAVIMGFYDWDFLDISDRTWIWLDNYRRMFWGTNMTWDLGNLWVWRVVGLGAIPFLVRAARRKSLSRTSAVLLIVGIVLLFGVAMGIHPGEDGRWSDSQFWNSFGNTILFVLMSTPTIAGLGLVLAVFLNRPGRLVAFLRTLFFAPYVLSVAVLTLIWAFLLNPNLGLIGSLFETIGLEPVNWLNNTTWAMPAIVLTTLWWTVGFNLVLFLAGLQDIDKSQYEAADIDGANPWEQFRYVTVPGLRRTTLLVITLQIIASFQIFGQVFIMTGGGPNGATRVAIQHIYESGFRDFELGYSSAMSLFLFLVMVGISFLQFKFLPTEEPT